MCGSAFIRQVTWGRRLPENGALPSAGQATLAGFACLSGENGVSKVAAHSPGPLIRMRRRALGVPRLLPPPSGAGGHPSRNPLMWTDQDALFAFTNMRPGSSQVGCHRTCRELVIGSLNSVPAGDLRAAVRTPAPTARVLPLPLTCLRSLPSVSGQVKSLRVPALAPGFSVRISRRHQDGANCAESCTTHSLSSV